MYTPPFLYIILSMKKAGYALIAIFAVVLIVLAVMGSGGGGEERNSDFIRIHIRAHSNARADQAVKYAVKDDVTAYLTPLIAGCENRADAARMLERNLSGISNAAERALKNAGLPYGARAELKEEYFPARDYDGVTLQSGIYDALIISLGDGDGDNWWCVVYPPLCFINTEYTDGQGVRYKSKIKELIDKFFA